MIGYVTDICPSCGNLQSVCSDPERAFYPQRHVCYATAVKDLTVRQLRKLHPKEPGEDLHPLDGVGISVSLYDLTPDDDFLVPEQMKPHARDGDEGAKEAQ